MSTLVRKEQYLTHVWGVGLMVITCLPLCSQAYDPAMVSPQRGSTGRIYIDDIQLTKRMSEPN